MTPTSLLRRFATVGAWTSASRVLGFVRDVAIAAVLGTGAGADAFFVALRVPNILRAFLADTALSAAFIPRYRALDSLQRARFAGQACAIVVLIALGLSLTIFVLMPQVISAMAYGFRDRPEAFELTIALARITLPYLTAMCIVSLLAAIHNVHGNFAAGAAAPVLFNLTLLVPLGILPLMETPPDPTRAAYILAGAVSVSGALQVCFLLATVRANGRMPLWSPPTLNPDMRAMLKAMAPIAASAAVIKITILTDQLLATFLVQGSVSFIYFADRMVQLPLAVLGIAMATALLPTLTHALHRRRLRACALYQNLACETSLVLSLPLCTLMCASAPVLISVLFVRGAFTDHDATATAAALQALAIGLPGFVLSKTLFCAFHANGMTRYIFSSAVITVIANLVLSLMLMRVLQHVGICLATALSAWLHVALLVRELRRRRIWSPAPDLVRRIGIAVGASTLAALPAALLVASETLTAATPGALFVLIAVVVLSFGFYVLFLIVGGVFSVQRLGKTLLRLRRRTVYTPKDHRDPTLPDHV